MGVAWTKRWIKSKVSAESGATEVNDRERTRGDSWARGPSGPEESLRCLGGGVVRAGGVQDGADERGGEGGHTSRERFWRRRGETGVAEGAWEGEEGGEEEKEETEVGGTEEESTEKELDKGREGEGWEGGGTGGGEGGVGTGRVRGTAATEE